MNMKLNLLENSQDYLINALELYHVADEYGEYQKDTATIENKAKWKLAFVSLVQAFELLMKLGLEKINPILVYENIDSPNLYTERTVKVMTSLKRLTNFGKNPYSNDELVFIKGCIGYRNDYIHYTVDIDFEKIKIRFSKLYSLYCRGYMEFCGEEMQLKIEKLKWVHKELISFHEEYIFYRGIEVRKDELQSIKEEIEKWGKHSYFTTSLGTQVDRIPFGNEIEHLDRSLISSESCIFYEYCPDCMAMQGEYHMPDCDIEICPICKKQKLSCECDLFLEGY